MKWEIQNMGQIGNKLHSKHRQSHSTMTQIKWYMVSVFEGSTSKHLMIWSAITTYTPLRAAKSFSTRISRTTVNCISNASSSRRGWWRSCYCFTRWSSRCDSSWRRGWIPATAILATVSAKLRSESITNYQWIRVSVTSLNYNKFKCCDNEELTASV